MAQTNPTPIPGSPAPPDRSDRATFSSKATAWADWLKNQGAPGMNTIATQTYNNAVDAYSNATAANNWAIKNDAAVSGGDWSAYAYAVGAAPTGNAKDWATKATVVAGGEFSARAYAVGAATDGSAKDWATKATVVAGGEYSAKYHATAAAASAASALNAPGTSATSTTSLTIAAVSQSLTIQTGKAFSVGQMVTIAQTSAPQNCMSGQITAHDPVTGALTVNVTAIQNTGTFSDWTISLGGLASGGSSTPSFLLMAQGVI